MDTFRRKNFWRPCLNDRATMKRTRKILQSDRLFFTLVLMKAKWGLAIIMIAVLSSVAFVPSARADGKMSALQTALSETTLSGYVSSATYSPSPFSAENQISELALQMAAVSHQEAANGGDLSSIFPPTQIDSTVSEAPPVFQSSLESPTSTQPAPEPSTYILCGLPLGLIALNRLNKRQ